MRQAVYRWLQDAWYGHGRGTWLLLPLSGMYWLVLSLRRSLYAAGLLRRERVPVPVIVVGNLTAGGTGKTTLTLHLAALAAARGLRSAVVVRDYRPGPDGMGDEHRMFRAALGVDAVFGGSSKRAAARRAVAAGAQVILVDDGFSHWGLARDLDLVLLDAADPWGGGALLPAGRLREPRRALQRADALILTRVPAGEDPRSRLADLARWAPGALRAAGRHEVRGVRRLTGGPVSGGRVRVMTATGHPQAVNASAAEAGLEVTGHAHFRDHHWFRPDEAERELARARSDRAALLLTAKDAVRWPIAPTDDVWVLEVAWRWVLGGDAVEQRVLGEGGA
jgi:tetraacyldisaccharide 4'-kinase